MKMLVTASQLLSGAGIASALATRRLTRDQRSKMAPRVPDVGLRQVEAERRQPRPDLLYKIKKRPVPQPMSISRNLRWSRPAKASASGGSACRLIAFAVPLNSTSTCVS